MRKKCSDEGCYRPLVARGFCATCYTRYSRRGVFATGSPTRRFKHRLTEKDEVDNKAVCMECGPVRIFKRESRGVKQQWRCGKDVNLRSKLKKREYRDIKKSTTIGQV